MNEIPDFDRIFERIALVTGAFQAPLDQMRDEITEALRQVWNARGQVDRGRIGEIICEQREPDYSLRMAQESIKALDR